MPNQKITFFTLLICVLLFPTVQQAQIPQKLTHQQTAVSFNNKTLYFFEDVNGTIDFEQVRQKTFAPVTRHRNSMGASKSAFWFRFQLQNTDLKQKDWWLEIAHPLLDQVDFYYKKNNQWKTLLLGDKLPFAKRPVDNRNFVIPLNFSNTNIQTYYLKVQSESSIQVPLTLYKPKTFHAKQGKEQLLYGMYFGILIVMALYNLPIFFTTRDSSYLLYVLFILTTGLFNAALEGYAFQYFWANQPSFASIAVIFFGGISGFFLFWYASVFLNTRKFAPFLRKVLMTAGTLCALTGILSFSSLVLTTKILPLLYIVSLPLMIYCAIVCYRRGMIAARFFLLAWTLVALGTIVYSLAATGVLPSNVITQQFTRISLVVAVILLSLALADRYRQYKEEREQAKAKVLDMQSETNEKLEIKVKERTKLLHKKNEEIATQNEELQQQQEEILAQNEFIAETNANLKKESKKTKESLQAAQAIQTAILPNDARLKELFDERLLVIYEPKDIVSGDFYWVSKVNEAFKVEDLWKPEKASLHSSEKMALKLTTKSLQAKDASFVAVVDCTGHGVPGAFMSMIGNSLLNEIVSEMQIYDTNKILDKLHEKLRLGLNHDEDTVMDQGMDVCLCKFEQMSDGTTKVTFTGSKRPLYYVKNGELGEVRGDRTPIGGWSFKARKPFNAKVMYFNKGDMLYLTTDGFVDMPNRRRKSFGTRRLKMMFEVYAHLPVAEQKEKFMQVMHDFLLSSEQRDDITILGLQI